MIPGQYLLLSTKYGPRPHIVLEISEKGIIALNRETLQQRTYPRTVWRHHPPSETINYRKIVGLLKAALRDRTKQFKGEPVRRAIALMEAEYVTPRRSKDTGQRKGQGKEGDTGDHAADPQQRGVEAAKGKKARAKRRVLARRPRRSRTARNKAPKRPFRLFEKHLKDA